MHSNYITILTYHQTNIVDHQQVPRRVKLSRFFFIFFSTGCPLCQFSVPRSTDRGVRLVFRWCAFSVRGEGTGDR
jgi:hypothetical protein